MSAATSGRPDLTPDGLGSRPVWAEIDLGAVRHNAALLARIAAPAELCAVVKADAYGHGVLPVARAALEGGASWLAVATAEEGIELRARRHRRPRARAVRAPARGHGRRRGPGPHPGPVHAPPAWPPPPQASRRAGVITDVHVKVDTGMHRVGADPDDLLGVVAAVAGEPSLRFAALWTHFPVADCVGDEDRAFTVGQLRLLTEARDALRAAGHESPMLHAANSAGTIAYPAARLDLVRCGIALYGAPPFPTLDDASAAVMASTGAADLRPVLSLYAQVAMVRAPRRRPAPLLRPPRRALARTSTLATVPLGYADGVPRRYFTGGGTVLIGGRRRPLAGMVTMDQIVVDCGPDDDVAAGDDVVLIGEQGGEALPASDWAEVLGTISHEVFCGIGSRVPRVVVDREGRP